MAIRIQIRRGTFEEWTASDPILAQGEVGLEIDTNKIKMGNGVDRWTQLRYSTINSIGDISNVDTSSLLDGSLLVYDSSINKWVATNELSKQRIDGGFW